VLLKYFTSNLTFKYLRGTLEIYLSYVFLMKAIGLMLFQLLRNIFLSYWAPRN